MEKIEINREKFQNLYDNLLGQVLTVIDVVCPDYSGGLSSAYTGNSQNKSVKDLIRSAFKREFDALVK